MPLVHQQTSWLYSYTPGTGQGMDTEENQAPQPSVGETIYQAGKAGS